MNIQQLRASGNIVFECITGSHAYGLNVEGSDTDIRGVFIQPTKEILSGVYMPQVSDETNDVTFYEIGRFIELLAKGNPNMIEMLNVSDDMIVQESGVFRGYFPPEVKEKFITTKLKHTFSGYAHSQIKKAKGLNKKINWDKTKVGRKDVLDFCYFIPDREKSILFKDLEEGRVKTKYLAGFMVEDGRINVQPKVDRDTTGLAKVNNVPDLYSIYYLPAGGGIMGEDSNDVQLRSIPKDAHFLGYLRFDRNAYSTHCKDYREYQEWLENRNPKRYEDNLKGEQGYDHKNMMHCMRLLGMAKDIAEGRGIVVRRPDREYLLSIRNGEAKYDELLENAEALTDEISELFDSTNLPKVVNPKFLQELRLRIRMDYI